MSTGAKRLLYIQYTDPAGYPPLEHSSRILAEAGWEILFLGIEQNHNLRFPPHPHIQVKLLSMVPPGWKQKVHYFYYWLWVVLWVLRWRPRWVYASDVLSTPVGLMLSYFPRLKVLYHEHDSPADNGQNSAFMRLVLGARLQLARRVTVNILPNAERGEQFQQRLNLKQSPSIVWNCPRLEEVSDVPNPTRIDCRLLYHGSIVRERVPLSIIEALTLLPESVSFHIYGYETDNSGYIEEIRSHADTLRVADRLHFHGSLPRHQLMVQVNQYDVGLCFIPTTQGDINLQMLIGASNKVFDYLARGVPLLVNDNQSWIREYVDKGYALACNPAHPKSIADAVQWYVEHPAERQQMGEAGRKQILREWHYEKQFEPVLQLMT
jgi:glycosyltransferase involved in cell wall biosynthesis